MSKTKELMNFEKVVAKESEALLSLSRNIVAKYLGGHLSSSNESKQIGEDFLFNAVTKLLIYANNDNSAEKLKLIETFEQATYSQEDGSESEEIKRPRVRKTPQELFHAQESDPKFIAKTLTVSVKNQCIDRLIRWSGDKDYKEKGFDETRSYERNLNPAVRARAYEPDSDEKFEGNWLEQILSYEDDIEAIFEDRLEGHMLVKGVTLEEIELIKLKLSGHSYIDIAEKMNEGASSDKYRKVITRALAKLNLKVKEIPR